MYKVGLSSGGFPLTEENFRLMEQSNIAAIEIAMATELYKLIDYKQLAELSQRYNVKLWSYHLPYYPARIIDVSSLNDEVQKSTLSVYTEMIQKATEVGVDKFVVHPSGEPIADDERELKLQRSMQTLDELAQIAKRYGAVIAVEDLPRSCLGNTADEMLRILSANDALRVCLDTNHLLQETNVEFMEKLGDKIVTVHISDYDFVDEQHWLPGEGLVNWNELYIMFQKIGYQGVWLYELPLKSTNPERIRDLTFADFVENANAIFNGNPLRRIY